MTLKEQIRGWMAGREDEFTEALAPLIAVDSTSGEPQPGMPFGPGPAKALDAALELAEKWGMKTGSDDGYVGTADLNDCPDELHILAHLDVVGAGDHWDTDPFTLVRDGDLIYGRGVDDDKGPAVASLLAMRCVKELGLPLTKNVKLILGTDEESGSGDIRHYYAHHPFAPCSISPDAEFPVTNIEKAHYAPSFSAAWEKQEGSCRISEVKGGIRINVAPANCSAKVTGLKAADIRNILQQVQEKTGVLFGAEDTAEGVCLEATGVQAHASTPDEGKNAITAMLEALVQLPVQKDGAYQAVCQLHELFPYGDNAGKAIGMAMEDAESGPLTLSFSLLELDQCGFHGRFDSRDPLCATPENTKQVCEEKMAALGWQCSGEFGPAHAVDGNSDFVRTLIASYEEFSGRKGYCESMGGGTYVHNIPGGVAFGAGEHDFDSRLHGANERARLSQLLMTAEIYAAVIARLCA